MTVSVHSANSFLTTESQKHNVLRKPQYDMHVDLNDRSVVCNVDKNRCGRSEFRGVDF